MSLCTPDLTAERAWALTPELLANRGVAGLLLDLDNTLIPYGYEGPVPAEVAGWLAALRQAGIAAALVTNARPSRSRRWGKKLGLPALPFAAKPLPLAIFWAAKALGLPRKKLLLVGDQIFTDLLAARLAGVRVALVRPLAPKELPHTRWLRRLERRCRGDYNREDRPAGGPGGEDEHANANR